MQQQLLCVLFLIRLTVPTAMASWPATRRWPHVDFFPVSVSRASPGSDGSAASHMVPSLTSHGHLHANQLNQDDQGRLILNDSRSHNALQQRAPVEAQSVSSTLVEDGTRAPTTPDVNWSARSSLCRHSSWTSPLFGFDVVLMLPAGSSRG